MMFIKRNKKPFQNSLELKHLDEQNNLKRIKKFNEWDKEYKIRTKINDGKNKSLEDYLK